MKKLLGFSLILMISASLFAQKGTNHDSFFKDYVSRTWNAEDGIQGNSITDILQDKDGYILFGTYGGLTRFDGVKFEVLNKLYDEKYNFFSARAIMEDSKGNIWVGSNDEGAHCIKTDGTVTSFTVSSGLPNNSVRTFCEDKMGNVWIGTASGIACVSPEFEIIKLQGFNSIPQDNRFIVTQIYCDTAGRIWLVTRSEKGLFKYEDGRFSVYEGITSVKNPVVTYMTQDSNDAYWFGVAPYHAVKISANNESLYNIASNEQRGTVVNCIYQDSEKNIWFAMDNGLTIYHDGEYYYYSKKEGLADDGVVKIIEDKEKNIWIATDRGGIQKFSTSKFQTTSMNTTVNAIAQDNFRQVTWLGCDDGLYCWKGGSFIQNEITEYCKNIRIRHVAVTKNGDLLVSCYEKYGQLRFNLEGSIQSWTKANGLAGDKIRVAEEMENGDLYIGTTTGLSIVDGKTGQVTNITKNEQITNDYIMCLYEAPDGKIWAGTDGGGIFILDNKKICQTITKANNLAGNVVFKIAGLRDDEIWVSTGTGVSRIKNGEIFTFNATNGFGSDGIFQVLTDFSGRLWGTSNRGIFYVKLQEIENVINGKQAAVNPKYFNRLDGITSSGVTATSLSMKDNLGRIWFTLIDGFTIFDPVRNSAKDYAPQIKIEDVYIDTEKVDISAGKIIIPPSAKRVKINYTGISFISSEQLLFQTKLEGFEKEYTEWSNTRMCTYTNLKPGSYKLYVQCQSGDEVLSKEAAVLEFVKKPYLWQRPWFIILIVVLVVGLTTAQIIAKMNRLKREKEKIEKLSIEVIQALVGTIDAKDKYTNGHSKRVAHYTVMLAKALGLSDDERREIYFSAILHDIGKIAIPDAIINKTGKLTNEEYDVVKKHPEVGHKILSSISIMPAISVGALSHHEHFDGSGYPNQTKGTEIPYWARIIGVADAYDAMTSNRSYRGIMEQAAVREEFVKNRGTQFDPEIADKMIEIIDNDTEYELHEQKSDKNE
ncbi:MAG: HD domain-containing protein [Treponema sp.]|nr:HD domain-containing protein [Treponema sp.]